jgi:hypothetical protein
VIRQRNGSRRPLASAGPRATRGLLSPESSFERTSDAPSLRGLPADRLAASTGVGPPIVRAPWSTRTSGRTRQPRSCSFEPREVLERSGPRASLAISPVPARSTTGPGFLTESLGRCDGLCSVHRPFGTFACPVPLRDDPQVVLLAAAPLLRPSLVCSQRGLEATDLAARPAPAERLSIGHPEGLPSKAAPTPFVIEPRSAGLGSARLRSIRSRSAPPWIGALRIGCLPPRRTLRPESIRSPRLVRRVSPANDIEARLSESCDSAPKLHRDP